MELYDLNGKNILLTGASRGLGEQIARSMWKRGANLLLVARSEKALSKIRAELVVSAQGEQKIDIFPADLSDLHAPAEIISHARQIWQRIDILINNAAIPGPIGKSWENPWDEWQMTIQINLIAPILLCRIAIPWMIEHRQGKIINLSGGGATGPRPNFSAYGTSKTALIRFSEILSHEVREFNIQVNCIAPGAMNTKMLEAVRQAGPEKAGEKEYTIAVKCANNGIGVPAPAVDLCCFLASAASNEITGKLISAIWDPWQSLSEHLKDLKNSDIYTLRRIVPKDRGKKWG